MTGTFWRTQGIEEQRFWSINTNAHCLGVGLRPLFRALEESLFGTRRNIFFLGDPVGSSIHHVQDGTRDFPSELHKKLESQMSSSSGSLYDHPVPLVCLLFVFAISVLLPCTLLSFSPSSTIFLQSQGLDLKNRLTRGSVFRSAQVINYDQRTESALVYNSVFNTCECQFFGHFTYAHNTF